MLSGLLVEMLRQSHERFHHVSVALVPGGEFTAEHIAIVLLGVANDECVLFGAKVGIRCHLSVALQIFHRLQAQSDQFLQDLLFTAGSYARRGSPAVSFRLFSKMIETTIMTTGSMRRFWIDFAQIIQHGLDRGVQAVKVQSVKAAFVAI